MKCIKVMPVASYGGSITELACSAFAGLNLLEAGLLVWIYAFRLIGKTMFNP